MLDRAGASVTKLGKLDQLPGAWSSAVAGSIMTAGAVRFRPSSRPSP